MRKFTLLMACLLGFVALQAQEAQIRSKSADGTPRFIQFAGEGARLAGASPEQLLKQHLNPEDLPTSFALMRADQDEIGMTHHKYQQHYKGIEVVYGTFTVHTQAGNALSMSGRYYSIDKDFVTKASLNKDAALSKALSFVGATKYQWQVAGSGYQKPEGQLVIVPKYAPNDKDQDMKPTLAYRFDIYAVSPVSRTHIFVDAHTGEVVNYNPIIKHAVNGTASTRYSGTKSIQTQSYNGSYRLRDDSRGGGILTYDMNEGTNYGSAVDFVDNDNNWTSAEWNNSNKDNAALDAHWGAQQTYDYFINKHNRNSYDGNGAAIRSYVHYDQAYDNAFWDGQRMTYGDGSGTYFDALTSLDVAAHEIGHAVCSNTADLVYQRESGALNEGFSDIWGAAVEYFAAPEKSTWLIGEDIERRSGSAALRSMSNPTSEGQPDTYGGTYWKEPQCGTPTRTNDYCGVHTNSGVLNYWFYLISVGGNGTNDIGSSFSVASIGIENAAKIAYRTEAVYLSSNSDFADARQFSIESAIDLFGAGSAEEQAVTNAWHAVGVGAAYTGGGSGGGSTCSDTEVNFSITFDQYPQETTWTIKTAAGATVASGSGSGAASGSSASETVCLPDGDYVFTINDSYGDGICCSYGNGSYSLTEGSTTLASGGSFASTESTSFTIGNAVVCDTPTGLSSSSITTTSFTLSWAAVTGASSYDVSVNGSVIASNVTGTSANVTGATAGTTYSCTVSTNCGGGATSDASAALSVTTLTATGGSAPTGYCNSKGNDSSYEWIDLVRVGGIDNATGDDSGYADYTSQTGSLTIGGSETIYFSAGFKSSSYTEHWAVYIDLNRDGDFDDSGEKLVAGSSSSANTLSAALNIPASASAGLTRMRVSMKYNAAQTSACETFSYGEVEDYIIDLQPAGSIVANLNPLRTLDGNIEGLGNEANVYDFTVYPNPAQSTISVVMGRGIESANVQIMDMTGRVWNTGEVNSGTATFSVEGLPNGLYLMQLNDGQKLVTKKFIKQ